MQYQMDMSLKEYGNIVNDVKAIVDKPIITRNQEKMIKNMYC